MTARKRSSSQISPEPAPTLVASPPGLQEEDRAVESRHAATEPKGSADVRTPEVSRPPHSTAQGNPWEEEQREAVDAELEAQQCPQGHATHARRTVQEDSCYVCSEMISRESIMQCTERVPTSVYCMSCQLERRDNILERQRNARPGPENLCQRFCSWKCNRRCVHPREHRGSYTCAPN